MQMKDVSQNTKNLYNAKAKMSRKKNNLGEFDKINHDIHQSSLKDHEDWIETNVTEMEAANRTGNTRKIFELLNHITSRPKPHPQNLTTDENGNLLKSAEDIAATWFCFLKKKFAKTCRELSRLFAPIPDFRAPDAGLKRAEFENAVNKLPNNKAVGPDDIPAEAIKYCAKVRADLFTIINLIWGKEHVPEAMALTRFKMIFKKENPDDPSKYRCLGLLNHSYKVLSNIILQRLMGPADKFLSD